MMDYEDFIKQIVFARKRRGWSMETLARKAEISRQALQNIEHLKKCPVLTNLYEIVFRTRYKYHIGRLTTDENNFVLFFVLVLSNVVEYCKLVMLVRNI